MTLTVDWLILGAAIFCLGAAIVVTLRALKVAPAAPEADGHHGVGHISGTPLLLWILTTLLFLTWITVAVSYIDLGSMNVIVAMGVATLKASIVALYFMHLRYDRPFNTVIILSSFVFLGIFISFALLDGSEYQAELVKPISDMTVQFKTGDG